MNKIDTMQQKNNKPMFDVIEPSLVRAHFASKKDVSFSSYLNKPHNNHNDHEHNHDHDHSNNNDDNRNMNKYGHVNIQSNKIEECDQISIFDAAKYFSGIHDNNNNNQSEQCNTKGVDVGPIVPPRLSSVSSSIETSSNYGGGGGGGGRNSHGNYRTWSFHATPTASSEASWNSQTGLLANPPGSVGISIIKSFSNNSNGSRGTNNSNNNVSVKWPRISTKWLNKGRKCPCLGKKSVQVEERIDPKTLPRMVDLRQGTNNSTSNGSSIGNTLYSPRQSSPKNLETIVSSSSTLRPLTHDTKNSNFNLMAKNPIDKNGYPYSNCSNGGSSLGLNSKVVGPLKVYDDLAKVAGGMTSTNNNVVITTSAATTVNTASATATSNGFTFPILENPPIGVKKMFNVTPHNHNNHNNDEPHRDSLEVFQPRSHPSPNKSRRTSYEDENVSDGSSDLFEIESFSTSTYPYRDSMDEVIVHSSNFGTSMKKLGIVCPSYNNSNGNNNNNRFRSHNDDISEIGNGDIDDEPMTPSVAPTDCYAPSEVSIDWSVTTAEGFDRGSLSNFSASASDFAYAAMRREAEQYKSSGGGGGGGGGECKGWHNDSTKGSGKNNNSGGGGMLLGCRNERAVSVGPSPIKCSTQEGPQVGARHVSGGPQVVRLAHVNGNGNTTKSNLVVGRSRSTLLPMPFTT